MSSTEARCKRTKVTRAYVATDCICRLNVSDSDWFSSRGILSAMGIYHQLTFSVGLNFADFDSRCLRIPVPH
jgi:hypothetical protein